MQSFATRTDKSQTFIQTFSTHRHVHTRVSGPGQWYLAMSSAVESNPSQWTSGIDGIT